MFQSLKSTLCAAFAAATLAFSGGAAQAEVRVQGAGATFPALLYVQWVESYAKAHPDVKADYQSIGSGGGIKAITDRTVSFGASDAPLSPDQEKAAPAKLLHLPTVAGPIVPIYNLPGVDKLTLNGDLVAAIFLKQITKWNDPKITALNPAIALPNSPIVVVHRSDGSGTSFIFTDYLSKVSKTWANDVGTGTTVDWPTGIAAKGNDGVAAAVKNSVGGIGYVEFAYAKKNAIPFASLLNAAGKIVPPSIDAINAASAAAVASFPADMKVSIVNSPAPEAYPICGFTYILLYDDLSYMKDKALAQATVDFIRWAETDGQEAAAGLGYAKLPKEVQTKVIDKLKAIKFNGEPLLK
jgi:phosphate transport system substrate-binding protein